MTSFWNNYLYLPLLNLLLYLYNGPAFGSMGIAIIELTILLRFALMPFTIVDERSRYQYEKISRKMDTLNRDFKDDYVKRKEKIRELLKNSRVSYWSKVVVLGIQALVLVLLYQVFIGGLRFTDSDQLYSWVTVPGTVNTMFLGFDLAARSLLWPAIVGILLFIEIYIEQKKRANLVTRSDVMYLLFFPIFSFVILLLLPMAKSLFILTTMIFSMLVFWVRQMFFPARAE